MGNPYVKTSILTVIFLVFLAANCFPVNGSPGVGSAVPDDNLAAEAMVIIKPPVNTAGRFVKLRITDAGSGKVLFDGQNMTKKRLLIIPQGNYIVESATYKNEININDGSGIISLTANKFVFEKIKPPPAITFKRGEREGLTTLTEGLSYSIVFLDINNLDTLPSNSYTVHISGPNINKDIPLAAATQNVRYTSADTLAITRGTFKITISLGGANLFPPQNITVIPKPPFVLTITNNWKTMFCNTQIYNVSRPQPIRKKIFRRICQKKTLTLLSTQMVIMQYL
jgi:hypothetical protein